MSHLPIWQNTLYSNCDPDDWKALNKQ
jgi:hypothetical protein